MRNKNQEENWEKRFDELFDSDVVCCNEGSQITHFGELELFKEVKPFIKELLKSEKEKLLERIEKIKPPVMKEEYFRELPSLKGIWYAGFSAGKKIILEKLKEEIKKELND